MVGPLREERTRRRLYCSCKFGLGPQAMTGIGQSKSITGHGDDNDEVRRKGHFGSTMERFLWAVSVS